MYEITVCGHFGGNKTFLDGQTIKTKNVYSALLNKCGKEKINILDTYNWKKNPFKFFINCIKALKSTKKLIILPAHNGVKVFVPLFIFLNKIYKRKIGYIVVGGWLPEMLETRKFLLSQTKKLDIVLVETKNMKIRLEKLGLNNVDTLLNFKNITPLKNSELNFKYIKPYKLCTFSRVMEEKGIEDAIEVVKKINDNFKEEICTLDIYGPIDEKYKERFNYLIDKFPKYIKYIGCVDSNKSVEILKDYYLLLFPTRFKTEGVPGTIIDAYAAGVPVIASKWENFDEVIDNNVTGIGYKIFDIEGLYNTLFNALNNEKIIYKMKKKCLKKFEEYDIFNSISKITDF